MDAIALLKADHAEVEKLFKRFERLGPRAKKTKGDISKKTIQALSQRAAIEEQVLYPAIRERMPDQEDMVLESLEEHHIASGCCPSSTAWTPTTNASTPSSPCWPRTSVTMSRR